MKSVRGVVVAGFLLMAVACVPDPTDPPPSTDPAPVQVAVSTTHGCAVMDDATVRCWGSNRNGQLGNGVATGNNETVSTAVTVSGLTDATQVAVGNYSSCAVRSGGGVVCWGLGSHGRLGTGGTTSSSVPATVTGITDATSVGVNNGAGFSGACASLATGRVTCWGSNLYGMLGTTAVPSGNTTNLSSSPVLVDGITDATRVSVGFDLACAQLTGGQVRCWGRNTSGGLGDPAQPTGNDAYSATPVTVVGLAGSSALTVGSAGACAEVGATFSCWGRGSASPTAIAGDPGFDTVAATSAGCGIDAGVASCWGPNNFHQLGNAAFPTTVPGTPFETPAVSATPLPVDGLPAAAEALGASYANTCAVLANDDVWCWGLDTFGALGTGTTDTGGRLAQRVLGV